MTTLLSACTLPSLPAEAPRIPPLPQTSMLFDADGRRITTLHAGENRILIHLNDMSRALRQAVIAAEDERFYHHHGVDAKAIIRAGIKNAARGEVVEGGSTITQQLVKNTITGSARTFGRKIREARLAYRLEDRYSKGKILEMYLNTVYFGQGAYGAQAAAKTYFSKHARDLSLPQAALLAGLIAAPSRLDPVFHAKAARSRRNYVLRRMRSVGMIGKRDFRRAVRTKVDLQLAHEKEYSAPYFVDYVKRWFLNSPRFGPNFDARYKRLFEGGLRIYTTLDLDLQKHAERAVQMVLTEQRDPYAAMTVLDPRTGAVKAMVGGRDYFSKSDPFAKVNLATGGTTGRQAGSAFKPFALIAALAQGISPNRLYRAPPALTFRLPPGSDPPTWPVRNYDGWSGGSMTLQEATINSVNTVYAQLIMEIGPDSVVQTARDMGITSDLAAVPSAVLGANEVNTLEMASAYGTLAMLGERARPHVVSKITDARGRVIYQPDTGRKRVLLPGVAWIANQILQNVVQRGTATQARIGRPAAGKTGTAQEWRDAWFVGYIPQLVGAVWVGFPERQIPMVYPTVRLSRITGGSWPAQIWRAFMVRATEEMPIEHWRMPEIEYISVKIDVTRGCVANEYTLPIDIRVRWFMRGTEPTKVCTEPSGPQIIPVPSVIGMTEEKARETLERYTFDISIQTEVVDGADPGTVAAQEPAPGMSALQQGSVVITVAAAQSVRKWVGPSPSPSSASQQGT
ncbi:MAG TPA: PBP1A family penicillin-binding protein [Actinomycetota bacterium]|nr:PBP1A family penicillin-binding protein [Actinomycetota bacterium]